MIAYKHVKFLLDKLVALLLLPILLVILLIIVIPQTVLYGKVFFIQNRPGKNEEIFSLFKFQTMKSGNGTDKSRLTFFGNILRKLGVDELPQVINILKGEMSFVGPRPLLIEYLPLYNRKHKLRHTVMPGITGLAQINGQKILDWNDKLEIDTEYVNSLSFLTDIKIVFSTFKLLFVRAGKSKERITGKFEGYEIKE